MSILPHVARHRAWLLSLALLLALGAGGCQKQQTPKRPFRQYTIEEFMSNVAIWGGGFSPDETKVLYTSNETGIYNAFAMPTQGGQPYQLTADTANSLFAISFFPNDERILYEQDRNGDENFHLFMLTKDGTSTNLTPHNLARASFVAWSYNGNSLYYTSNKRNPKLDDLYQMDVQTMTERLVYANDSALNVSAISRDDRYVTLLREITFNKTEVFLLDRQTQTQKRILASTDDAMFWPAYFSPDGLQLYCLSNEGSEFSYLMRYDIATGAKEKVYQEPWDIVFASLSYTGRYTVVGINNNAQTELKLYDNRTGKQVALPSLPAGRTYGVTFSRSDRHMLFNVNSSRQPNSLYVMDMATLRLRRLTTTLNPQMQEDHLVEARTVQYPSFDGLAIPALLYTPHNIKPGEKLPAVVVVHGGPGGQSSIDYSPLRQYMANHGYVVLAVNNRGSSGYGKTFYAKDDRRHGIDDLQDCIEAKKYLASLGYVDTNRVGILGASYGGYIVLSALAFKPDAFAVGVDLFGVSNWEHLLKSLPPYWEGIRQAFYREVGDPVKDAKMLHDKSPLFFAQNIRKPLFVYQGANDVRVPRAESDELVAAVKRNNVPVQYVLLPDEGHGLLKRNNQIQVYGQIMHFLETYLD
jgi:dipeptidyl aminopeptidase/acylaminoacyl peptidase